MASKFLRIQFISLILLSFLFVGCSKNEETDPEEEKEMQLVRATSWDSATGTEVTFLELTYHNDKKLNIIKHAGFDYTVSYANNRIATIKGKNSAGIERNFTMTYANSRLTTMVITSTDPKNLESLATFEYDAAGNLKKSVVKSTTVPDLTSTVEYTYEGGVLTAYKWTAGPIVRHLRNIKLDNKKNPLYFEEGIWEFFSGTPQTLRNILEYDEMATNGVDYHMKKNYTYNEAGYATSMVFDGYPKDGQKYYYQ